MKRLLTIAVAGALTVTMAVLLTGCPFNRPATKPKMPEPEPKMRQPAPALKPGAYFPLTRGSTWVYQGEGNEFASFKREVVFAKKERSQVKEDNGGTVSASVFVTSEEAVRRVFFQGEAYQDKNFLNKKPTENTVILKSPLEAGTKWETTGGAREIMDVKATVVTPAGKFEDCLKVKISGSDSLLYEYFKQGVGMVKREFRSGETVVTSSLEKFTVK